MKYKIVLFMIAVIFVFGENNASAYNLEITPGGTTYVNVMDIVFFDVLFNPEGTVEVGPSYIFNMYYDNAELSWNSSLTDSTPPSPLTPFFGDLSETTPGFIENFNGMSIGGNAVLSSPTPLATLAFDVISPSGDGAADVWFDTAQNSNFGFTVGGDEVLMSEMTISGTAPDIAVVPEPVSSTLFLIGGAFLGFRRFRKRG